jgi:hypothetical protein
MHPDWAPWPDGFTGAFYQRAWPIIKRDIIAGLLKLSNTSQCGCGVRGSKTSSATTKTLENEKLYLKEIDTSKMGGIEQFFTKTRYWIFSGYPPTFLLWTPLLCEPFLGVQQEERKKSQEEG